MIDLESYDWEHIIEEYCFEPHVTPADWAEFKQGQAAASFTINDIEHTIAYEDGDNDGPEWIAIFKLKNKKYAFVEASCDYTGWGCQESGRSYVANSLLELVRWAITPETAERFGSIKDV
jgi:hypothetical protein